MFDPIGIISRPGIEPLSVPENSGQYERAGFAWPVDPEGINLGDSLLRITPRDLLTFGRLYLDGGRAGGKQVVPADWVRDSTSQQVPPTSQRDGYGYLWWAGTDDDDPAFRAVGYGGQLIEVVPSRKLVLVIAADVSLTDPNDPGISGSGARVLADTFILPEFT